MKSNGVSPTANEKGGTVRCFKVDGDMARTLQAYLREELLPTLLAPWTIDTTWLFPRCFTQPRNTHCVFRAGNPPSA